MASVGIACQPYIVFSGLNVASGPVPSKQRELHGSQALGLAGGLVGMTLAVGSFPFLAVGSLYVGYAMLGGGCTVSIAGCAYGLYSRTSAVPRIPMTEGTPGLGPLNWGSRSRVAPMPTEVQPTHNESVQNPASVHGCPICLADEVSLGWVLLQCGHAFHVACVEQQSTMDNRVLGCATCRHPSGEMIHNDPLLHHLLAVAHSSYRSPMLDAAEEQYWPIYLASAKKRFWDIVWVPWFLIVGMSKMDKLLKTSFSVDNYRDLVGHARSLEVFWSNPEFSDALFNIYKVQDRNSLLMPLKTLGDAASSNVPVPQTDLRRYVESLEETRKSIQSMCVSVTFWNNYLAWSIIEAKAGVIRQVEAIPENSHNQHTNENPRGSTDQHNTCDV